MASQRNKSHLILIVDDDERNIRLLSALLGPEGFEVLPALSGKEALELVSKTEPDLILLDIMMPDMDGYEVCRILKSKEETRIIPIVMVTSLSDREDKLKAVEVGADEFLTKPVDKTELIIRVKSLLRMKSYHDELVRSYRTLELQNRRLSELERTKEELTHMVIHDLSNPLLAISGIFELLLMRNDNFTENQINLFKKGLSSCEQIKSMIQNMLDIYRMEEGKIELHRVGTDIVQITKQTIEMFLLSLELKEIKLTLSSEENLPRVMVDPVMINRTISNLLSNAIKYTPRGGEIKLKLFYDSNINSICFQIEDSGEGIPAEYREKIFDRFEQIKMRHKGIISGSCGLGLAFCRLAVGAHGGRIWVEGNDSKGSKFCFTIPVETEYSKN